MKRVARTAKPPSLVKNSARWLRELLAALEDPNCDRRTRNRLYCRYNTKDVREALEGMYGSLCCYCEARVAHVARQHIEHRRPRITFPRYTFEWSNLHLACPACNNYKAQQWDDTAPILDAAADDPTEHLSYRVTSLGVLQLALTARGDTTQKHAQLNRQQLVEHRTQLFLDVLSTLRDFREARRRNPQAPMLGVLEWELRQKAAGQYGSLVAFAIEGFLE